MIASAKVCVAEPAAPSVPLVCFLSYSSLFANFEQPIPDYSLVHFEDKNGRWQQWLDVPKSASDGSSLMVDTEFLGQQGPRSSRNIDVLCSVEDAARTTNPWNLSGVTCPDVALVVDNGPEVDVHEVYFDGSNLRVVFEVVEQKMFATGIANLDERLALSINGSVVKTIPVRGFEPQMVLGQLKLARGRHYSVVYGMLDNGGDHKGKLTTPNGVICI